MHSSWRNLLRRTLIKIGVFYGRSEADFDPLDFLPVKKEKNMSITKSIFKEESYGRMSPPVDNSIIIRLIGQSW